MDRSWILLVFLVLLQFSESNGGHLYQTVRTEANVSLFCENRTSDQPQCEFTNWAFFRDFGKTPTVLFVKGQKKKMQSGVSLSEKCSLVLERVSEKQAGLYYCSQYDRDYTRREEYTYIYLSVVTLRGNRAGDRVTLSCSETRYGECRVKWLNNGEEVDKDHEQLQTSHSDCEASVSFLDGAPPSQFNETLQCEVTDDITEKKFTFRPRSEEIITETATKTTPTVRTETHTGLLLRHVVGGVALAALIMCVGAVLLWTRTKGPRAQRKQCTVDTVEYDNVDVGLF